MSTMLFGMMRGPTNAPDENAVRRPSAPYNQSAPAAVADDAPDPNEVETYSDPSLGLANRQVASAWVQGTKYAPGWVGTATAPHDAIVNDVRASVGTAAQRESTGTFGHGSMSFAVGIEPVADKTSAGGFGNAYFEGDPSTIQQGTGNFMSPMPDGESVRVAGTEGVAAQREARNSPYRQWYAHMVGM